jgi:hypothetical protein
MPLYNARTVECEVCKERYTEPEFGLGFPGWAIIQGIASKEPADVNNIQPSDMTTFYCPRHTLDIANAIDEIIEEECHDIPGEPVMPENITRKETEV